MFLLYGCLPSVYEKVPEVISQSKDVLLSTRVTPHISNNVKMMARVLVLIILLESNIMDRWLLNMHMNVL